METTFAISRETNSTTQDGKEILCTHNFSGVLEMPKINLQVISSINRKRVSRQHTHQTQQAHTQRHKTSSMNQSVETRTFYNCNKKMSSI